VLRPIACILACSAFLYVAGQPGLASAQRRVSVQSFVGPHGSSLRGDMIRSLQEENDVVVVPSAEVDAAAEAQDEVEHEAYVRMRSLERRYVLLSASLLFIGSTSDGVGIDAFLEQQRRTRGRNISFSLRLGAEAEIVPDWVKLRAGFYIEPARQTGVAPRPHVTVGTDVRLFTLFGTTVRGTFTLDGAPRYADVGVGVGVWH